MAYVLGLLVLVVGLLVSIALHEVGHLVPAKRFGVRVSRYMVGFGPTLWSRTRGETEYGLKAIPLGGYVRLIGMFPSAEVVGARRRAGRVAELVEAAREASADEIRPGEEHRAFYRLSTPKKVVVMLGGPLMNLVIATVLLAVVLMGFGVPTGPATTTVAVVVDCMLPPDATSQAGCTEEDPATPAAAAGLQPGDVVLSYAGAPVATWEEVQAAIRDGGTGQVPLVVERDGERVTLDVRPVPTERLVLDADGEPVVGADGAAVTETVPYLGVIPSSGIERHSPGEVLAAVGDGVVQTAGVVVALPVHLWDVVRSTVSGAERAPDSVVGVVGVARFAGELAADGGSVYGLRAEIQSQLALLASLNIALFVFNLIPLPPLDGGHVAGALWEGGRRQVARLRGAPRPGPADVARMMPLAYGVFLALAVMGVVLIYADLVNPVRITG